MHAGADGNAKQNIALQKAVMASSPKMEERCRKVCVIEIARSVPAAREVPLEPLVLTSTNAGPQQSK